MTAPRSQSPTDADDLVQDAVIKAYRFFDSYEAGTNVRAWLLKILTNVFFSKYRRTTLEGTVHAHVLGRPLFDDQRLTDALVEAMLRIALPSKETSWPSSS